MSLHQLLSHEYIHVVSSYAIDNVESMPKEVQDAVNIIKASYKTLLNNEKQNYIMFGDEVLPNEDLYYGLSSEKEMIAELANPRFREVLRRNNLLNNIIDSVKKLY